jgi:O-antigen ligase
MLDLFQILFLLCLGLCIWKRLWIALIVLGGVIVASNFLHHGFGMTGWAILTAVVGVLFVFPTLVYFDLERREKQERKKTIGRSRRRTGRS